MRFLIPPGKRVLELGCGRGDLLAALKPSYGVGIDFGAETTAKANARHPDLYFVWAMWSCRKRWLRSKGRSITCDRRYYRMFE